MASQMMIRVICIVVLLACVTFSASATMSCYSADSKILPCINYLRVGGTPSRRCCNGVVTLNAEAATTLDRQATCTCLKQAAATVPGIQPRFIAALPENCGVLLPYRISLTMDCSMVT